MKNVQISEELFVAIMRYFMLEQVELLPQIKQGLEKKLDAMVMRELYTKYKTAPTEEEKEKARKEYLDRRGVPGAFLPAEINVHKPPLCQPHHIFLIHSNGSVTPSRYICLRKTTTEKSPAGRKT